MEKLIAQMVMKSLETMIKDTSYVLSEELRILATHSGMNGNDF